MISIVSSKLSNIYLNFLFKSPFLTISFIIFGRWRPKKYGKNITGIVEGKYMTADIGLKVVVWSVNNE